MKKSSTILCVALAATLAMNFSGCALFKKKGSGSSSDGDYVNGTPLSERDESVSFNSDSVDKSRFKPVHFGFDSYSIESSEQPRLDEVADFMKSASNKVIIAGFTDERGTAEYNRALGERRAESVRQYLISHGADAGRLQTVSFGAEMPADPGSNEGAWAKNRRAEFGIAK
jgi:peptidoglycan-associated lipoprotein